MYREAATSFSPPVLLVLSGPGGAGKGAVAKALVERDQNLELSRSWTTRPPRKEEPSNSYVFVDRDAFIAHRKRDGFLEWNEFLGELYGTPRPQSNGDLLLEIDVAGGRQVQDRRPDVLLVFLEAPSDMELRRRLIGRGETSAIADIRIAEARRERLEAIELGYRTVINDDIDDAVNEIMAMLDARRSSDRSGE